MPRLPPKIWPTGSASHLNLITEYQADFPVEHGEAAPGEIQSLGLGCDVASEESVKATFQAIKDKFGRIDVSNTPVFDGFRLIV
jgi:NAD(P)-dependent dehydrogenase (short-subunit alcohol dehydrogenase family)